MNLNRATLFPGLDGFAASLRLRLLDNSLIREVARLDEAEEKFLK